MTYYYVILCVSDNPYETDVVAVYKSPKKAADRAVKMAMKTRHSRYIVREVPYYVK